MSKYRHQLPQHPEYGWDLTPFDDEATMRGPRAQRAAAARRERQAAHDAREALRHGTPDEPQRPATGDMVREYARAALDQRAIDLPVKSLDELQGKSGHPGWIYVDLPGRLPRGQYRVLGDIPCDTWTNVVLGVQGFADDVRQALDELAALKPPDPPPCPVCAVGLVPNGEPCQACVISAQEAQEPYATEPNPVTVGGTVTDGAMDVDPRPNKWRDLAVDMEINQAQDYRLVDEAVSTQYGLADDVARRLMETWSADGAVTGRWSSTKHHVSNRPRTETPREPEPAPSQSAEASPEPATSERTPLPDGWTWSSHPNLPCCALGPFAAPGQGDWAHVETIEGSSRLGYIRTKTRDQVIPPAVHNALVREARRLGLVCYEERREPDDTPKADQTHTDIPIARPRRHRGQWWAKPDSGFRPEIGTTFRIEPRSCPSWVGAVVDIDHRAGLVKVRKCQA